MNRKVPVLLATAVALLLASVQARALDLRGTLWESVATRHGLDAALLYAIAVQETGRPSGNGTVAPWPWTLGARNGPRFYESRDAALEALQGVMRKPPTVIIGHPPHF